MQSRRVKLLLATTNAGKIREITALLSDLPLELVSLREAGVTRLVDETGATIMDNAILKAREYARMTGMLTLADDSGIEVDALDGRPGVHSARFAGVDASDDQRNAYLLGLLKDVPPARRGARFRCVVAVATPDLHVETSEGTVEGVIAREPKGKNGFGYDSIFFAPSLGKHMGEISFEEKNKISHRAKATAGAKPIVERLIRSISEASQR